MTLRHPGFLLRRRIAAKTASDLCQSRSDARSPEVDLDSPVSQHQHWCQSGAMDFGPLPATVAWQHLGPRAGFEVVFIEHVDDGLRMVGHTTAVEDAQPWLVSYEIRLDHAWITRSTIVSGQSAVGTRSIRLDADGLGHWRVDGVAAPQLSGCLDVDLESSALTNAFPVHRLRLLDVPVAVPAVYVRALDLSMDRLDQTYAHVRNAGGADDETRYDYAAPAFDFTCTLVYDDAGLVLDYPGIATRVE